MNYRIDKDRYEFAVGGGFVYVDGDNTVTLIVNDIESPEEIDLRRAEEAKARAEEIKDQRIQKSIYSVLKLH